MSRIWEKMNAKGWWERIRTSTPILSVEVLSVANECYRKNVFLLLIILTLTDLIKSNSILYDPSQKPRLAMYSGLRRKSKPFSFVLRPSSFAEVLALQPRISPFRIIT